MQNLVELGPVGLPKFSGTRVMMLPVLIGDGNSLPGYLSKWDSAFDELSLLARPEVQGKVGYLTIDERVVEPGNTLRRSGLHVDGWWHGNPGAWGGGDDGGGTWGRNGMITVSTPAGCRAWSSGMIGEPEDEGECEHLRSQFSEESGVVLPAGMAYWFGPMCVHESLPMTQRTERQFVRLSMPSKGPWFDGYTENLMVQPTGPILPRREFM
jgi:hypothetical protein